SPPVLRGDRLQARSAARGMPGSPALLEPAGPPGPRPPEAVASDPADVQSFTDPAARPSCAATASRPARPPGACPDLRPSWSPQGHQGPAP
ncbi:hypothetical protein AB0J44_38720, partial [Streptomyces canus]